MISIRKILKQAWHILWSYKILWVFGILLALTAGGGSSSGSSGWRSQANQNASGGNTGFGTGVLPANSPQWVRQLADWFVKDVEPLFVHPEQHIRTFVMIGVILFLIIMVLSILSAFVRYPAETAVMRMVDEYEQSGNKMKFGEGWKLGWNRRAFRLWVIDLILGLPVFVLILLMTGAGVLVYLNVSANSQAPNVAGIVFGAAFGILVLLVLIALAILLTLLRNFFARAVSLDGMDVKTSFKFGWAMFKRNWKSAGLMLLVMAGIGFAVGIAGFILFFLLIPAYVVLVIPAVLVSSVPALIAYGVSSIFAHAPITWIITVLAAIPFFFTVVFAPLFLFAGWYKIFESNVWTLTYREIKAVEALAAPAMPAEGVESGKK
jgi:hypothetical protein